MSDGYTWTAERRGSAHAIQREYDVSRGASRRSPAHSSIARSRSSIVAGKLRDASSAGNDLQGARGKKSRAVARSIVSVKVYAPGSRSIVGPLSSQITRILVASREPADSSHRTTVSTVLDCNTAVAHAELNIERMRGKAAALHRRLHDERLTRADTPGHCDIHGVFGSRGDPKDGGLPRASSSTPQTSSVGSVSRPGLERLRHVITPSRGATTRTKSRRSIPGQATRRFRRPRHPAQREYRRFSGCDALDATQVNVLDQVLSCAQNIAGDAGRNPALRPAQMPRHLLCLQDQALDVVRTGNTDEIDLVTARCIRENPRVWPVPLTDVEDDRHFCACHRSALVISDAACHFKCHRLSWWARDRTWRGCRRRERGGGGDTGTRLEESATSVGGHHTPLPIASRRGEQRCEPGRCDMG